MHYCIVDLECTCWERKDPDKTFHETIEIGAVLLDDGLNVVDDFQTFVRPTFSRTLSTYCTDLTTITQEQVDAAPPFDKAMELFEQWIRGHTGRPLRELTLVSWGGFDRNQFENDCARNSYPYPFGEHLNLKVAFSEFINKPKKKFGLGKAARVCGIKFEGTPHRGIDDARMVAKIFQFMQQGLK